MHCDFPFALHPQPGVQKPPSKNLAFVFANLFCSAAQPWAMLLANLLAAARPISC
jgi:hypothetical protein